MRNEHKTLLNKKVDSERIERYLGKKNGYFGQVKPSEAQAALQQAAEDLLILVETFRTHRKIRGMAVFRLLQRVLDEQCHVSGEGEDAKVEVKKSQGSSFRQFAESIG